MEAELPLTNRLICRGLKKGRQRPGQPGLDSGANTRQRAQHLLPRRSDSYSPDPHFLLRDKRSALARARQSRAKGGWSQPALVRSQIACGPALRWGGVCITEVTRNWALPNPRSSVARRRHKKRLRRAGEISEARGLPLLKEASRIPVMAEDYGWSSPQAEAGGAGSPETKRWAREKEETKEIQC